MISENDRFHAKRLPGLPVFPHAGNEQRQAVQEPCRSHFCRITDLQRQIEISQTAAGTVQKRGRIFLFLHHKKLHPVGQKIKESILPAFRRPGQRIIRASVRRPAGTTSHRHPAERIRCCICPDSQKLRGALMQQVCFPQNLQSVPQVPLPVLVKRHAQDLREDFPQPLHRVFPGHGSGIRRCGLLPNFLQAPGGLAAALRISPAVHGGSQIQIIGPDP